MLDETGTVRPVIRGLLGSGDSANPSWRAP